MARYIDPQTNETFPIDKPIWRAPSGGPLMLTELPGITKGEIDTSVRSIWRYRAAFPLDVKEPITMGEGCTPLVTKTFGGATCSFKLEWFAPTGSFKDRGTSVMLSMLKAQGITSVLEDSSGNGGCSVAGYGAAGGLSTCICVPESTSPSKIAQVRAYGAEVVLVPGPREATEAAAIEKSAEIFYASHNWHPFFLQGTKTLGYEIWEDFNFSLPDNIVIPGGAGSNVLGCYIAFKELMAAGEIEKMPRIFLSQPAHCAPVHASFQAGAEECVETDFAPTVAEGTAIKRPIRMKQILAALRESGGGTVAIPEEEIIKTSLALARTGLYTEPTSAHAAAAFTRLLEVGAIKADEQTVVILTGTGIKTTPFYEAQLASE
ncbi:threonine synthase [Desulfoluna spongiiphila]|uniref:Threonine synthase n=1 Tax=Desulfoluna spongiiphila TaxID=419481 RepID=A0A1G5I1C8_9BACT|nr:threonine synthase [Desulfoluna spongiiphila]SCY69823.1 threonine synthase [Desulfoluna spongiiphila]